MGRSDDSFALFGRSFLLTLGLLFIGLPAWIWHKQGDRSSEWPTFAWVMFWGVGLLGFVVLFIGVFASARSVERWADRASTHEVSLVIMIAAAPVYFVIKWFTRRR